MPYLTPQNLPPLLLSSSLSPCFAFYKRKKKVCRLFCSVGPLLHQFSQARKSLEAYVVKMFRHVVENTRDGRRVKLYVRGNVVRSISMTAVHLETPEKQAGQRGGSNRPHQPCDRLGEKKNLIQIQKDVQPVKV